MIFVAGRSKQAIEYHFDKPDEIEAELETRGKKNCSIDNTMRQPLLSAFSRSTLQQLQRELD
jgi:UTP-glucose-1-phosphate uridylyltransferase